MSHQGLSVRFKQVTKKVCGLLVAGCAMVATINLSGCAPKPYKDPLQKFRHETAKQLFIGGNTDLAAKHYAKAAQQYAALDAMYPFGLYNQKAQLYVIYANYKNGDMLATDLAAQRYIRLYPRDVHTDYAYFMSALANFSEGQTWLSKRLGAHNSERDLQFYQIGYHNLMDLIQAYPHSKYYHAAVLYMEYVRNLAAKHQYDIAQFYFKRKAYVATINRCNRLLVHVPKSTYAQKALLLMIKSYQLLNLPKQAAYYQAIYNKTF